MPSLTVEEILHYVVTTYDGVCENTNWGERGVFYNPDNILPKGVYILTFKEKDGANDKASNVNRDDIYRLNLGISKRSFQARFETIPKRPAAGNIVDTGHDFQALDQITPHPVYGWMSWIAVLNPTAETFEELKPLIEEAIKAAKLKYAKKIKNL